MRREVLVRLPSVAVWVGSRAVVGIRIGRARGSIWVRCAGGGVWVYRARRRVWVGCVRLGRVLVLLIRRVWVIVAILSV
jgi:hypothetical protein